MKRLQWFVMSTVRILGGEGLAACALLALAAGGFVVRVLPLQQQIEHHLAQQAATQQAVTAAGGAAAFAAAPASGRDVFIPARADLNRQLLEVRALAEKLGLDVRVTEYSLSKVEGASLWRYQMTFPLESGYPSVQRFVSEMLRALPNLALNSIDIARSDEEEGRVTANLRFTLYFRQEQ